MRYLSCSLFVLLYFVVCTPFAYAQGIASEAESVAEESAAPVDILPPGATFLGESEENGVLAMAWIYRTPMVEGSDTDAQFPYILFCRFLSVDSNIVIDKGLVAYKLESFDDEKTPAKQLEFKNGYFVAGLDSEAAGYSKMHIGCKLEDENKRQLFKF